jgi:hypothetical protein
MRNFERKLTFYGLPTLIQDLLIRLRLVPESCILALKQPGYDLPRNSRKSPLDILIRFSGVFPFQSKRSSIVNGTAKPLYGSISKPGLDMGEPLRTRRMDGSRQGTSAADSVLSGDHELADVSAGSNLLTGHLC